MLDLVNVALRTLMCLAFLVWVVRPMLFALSRREPNQVEIEELVDSAVHSAFKSLGVKNPPPRLPSIAATSEVSHALEQPAATEQAESPIADQEVVTESSQALVTLVAEETQTASVATEPASQEAEPDPEEALRQMRERIKQEQKKTAKPTIPTELLQDASSYEDKLMVVQMMVDQEQARVASVLKRMIKIDG
jgi:hypothetical protein